MWVIGTPAHTSKDITGHLNTETSTSAQFQFDAIREWHNNCRRYHKRCKKTLSQCDNIDTENSPLPTRCIEVRFNCGQEKCSACGISFRLQHTDGQTGRYIALSHRWVLETEDARTLKSNYDCRIGSCHEGDSCQSGQLVMGQVFNDTGHLALQLGIKYIWIDSVCIVQDDSDDWNRESVKMADYYQHAWLTVSATKTSEFGGLFTEVDIKNLPRIAPLPYRDKTGEQKGHFYVQSGSGPAVANAYKTYVRNSELLKRGWVYQEWILSRRLLTFSNAGLFLTCQSDPPRSTFSEYIADRLEPEERTKPVFNFGKKELKDDDFSTIAKILSTWEKIVKRYSALQLTKFDGDRLVALAGVASEYGKGLRAIEQEEQGKSSTGSQAVARVPYRYVSGVWFPHLHSLTWEPIIHGTPARVGGIPTWSWASMKTLDEDTGEYCGMGVQWSSTEPKTKTTEVCRLVDAIRVPVENIDEKKDIWEVIIDKAGQVSLEDTYGNNHRFFILELRGYLQAVQIHGYFESKDDTDAVATLTSHQPDLGKGKWHKVTIADAGPDVIGWASIEHPDYQKDVDDEMNGPIYIVFISSIGNINRGFAVGNIFSYYHTAYEVLYLRPKEVSGYGNMYERVGVGRLYDVEALYKSLEAHDPEKILLV